MSQSDFPLKVRPDFLIIGAMKSGTTSLHELLAADPRIFIPDGETQLFSIDDFEQNPVFFQYRDRAWTYPHFQRDAALLADWHATEYQEAQDGQLLGEDAPTYLASQAAIDRIATHLPDARLIVSLRDPVERLHSQYWHWMRTYRAHYSLEETLQFQTGNLLQRSSYESQLRYLFARVPREHVLVLIFESTIQAPASTTEALYQFLGLSVPLETAPAKPHANAGFFPKHPGMAQWRNRVYRHRFGRKYQRRVPWLPDAQEESALTKLGHRIMQRVNPSIRNRPGPMRPETRAFLTELLRDRNAGLPELLGVDLASYWPTFATP